MELHLGDCIEVLRMLAPNSVDSIVTDPPYGWRFMGKAWDGEDIVKKAQTHTHQGTRSDGGTQKAPRLGNSAAAGLYDVSPSGNQAFQEWTELWAKEALRVLKPGGHALIFCGPRTYHRMASGVEDAGFEVRDQLQWLFGSGFPKSLDISKAIDKAAGVEREITREGQTKPEEFSGKFDQSPSELRERRDKPATNEAKQWSGWGTALKPANEPILLARKPLSEETVAKNVLRWGTGGLNIDASRIGTAADKPARSVSDRDGRAAHGFMGGGIRANLTAQLEINSKGRFPANLLLDEVAAEMLDEQSGIGKSKSAYRGDMARVDAGTNEKRNTKIGTNSIRGHDDSGGASRFFFIAANGLILCDAKTIFSEWKTKNANTVESCTSLSAEHVDSVLKHAVTLVLPEVTVLSVSIPPSIHANQEELSLLCETVTAPILNFDSGVWQEPLRERLIQSKSRVRVVEMSALTGTMTIMASHWKLDGSVDDAISITIKSSLVHGEKVCASRFRYCAKTSKSERNAGLEGMPEVKCGIMEDDNYPIKTGSGNLRDTKNQNHHPTVKPIKLMQYLINLVTPPKGIVLDPFMGSGSTGVAAIKDGFDFVGIEREAEYMEIAQRRIGHAKVVEST